MSRPFFIGIFPIVAATTLLVSFSFANATAPAAKPASEVHMSAHDMEVTEKKAVANDPKAIAKILAYFKNAPEQDPNVVAFGNPKADVTVVEFFDYHCGHCKVFMSTLNKRVKADPNLRVVLVEFPIMTQDSVLAARAALAVNKIDKTKYMAYFTALMKTFGTFDVDNLTKLAVSVGVDEKAFRHTLADADLLNTINTDKELAAAIHIAETPAFIIGNKVHHGLIDEDVLKTEVDALHKKS